jgi:hypothetical protein
MKKYFFYILIIFAFSKIMVLSSCANIIAPTGGPKDTLPPVLISAIPKDSLTSFHAYKIVLNFDEYVQLDNIMDNLVVSPNPQIQPTVEGKLRTVTIKLKDSLLPNTTYTLNFGNAVKDVNEGNIKRNFSYIFSTGKTIDNHVLSGKVILAQTGGIDSTLIVVLQKGLADSFIIKHRPLYYAKLDGKGNFQFRNLPADTFAVYVLPNDYTKRYDDSTKLFAFSNDPVILSDSTRVPTLYAYQQFKEKEKKSSSGGSNNNNNSSQSSDDKKKKAEENKRLRFASTLENDRQDILTNLQIVFSHKVKTFDSSKISFTDTNYIPINGARFNLDTSGKILTLFYKWPQDKQYRLIMAKNVVTDSVGTMLSKSDTLSFTTMKESDYGSITLRFTGLDLSKNPVLQMVQTDKVVDSVPLTSNEWHRDLYEPGEYQIRILYDNNKNGTWDAGDFKKKLQPEIVQATGKKFTLKRDWENEEEINLNDQTSADKTPPKTN